MQIIEKSEDDRQKAQLKDYQSFYESFTWQDAASSITGLPKHGGINMAFEAIDRHVLHFNQGQKLALRWRKKSGLIKDYSYQDLYQESNRFANLLKDFCLIKGDRVFILSNRVPELYIGLLGSLKHRCICSPLFAAFGPEPIKTRMELGSCQVLLTNEAIYRKKIQPMRKYLTDLRFVILIDGERGCYKEQADVFSYAELMQKSSELYLIENTDPEDPALIHFTSGTTGMPKGALHVHGAILAHHVTGLYALDLHKDDVFWCTADPGWVTGTSYGILSPLSHGVTMIVDEGDFDQERWYQILCEEKVNVWYTAPTAIRMLMKMGDEAFKRFKSNSLRFIASVGEPLNPEAVKWGQRVFQRPIHDNWWQTETGGIMISNFASMDIKPGSMGKPVPGIAAKIVQHDGQTITDVKVNEVGELALKAPWPSMFRAYLGQDERYKKAFVQGWYLTGDLAKRDDDGYFWFIGRADDLIKSAGHLIGPFELESALLEHPAVAEAAVIGKPDALLLEIVKAFVTLKLGFTPSEELQMDILAFARKRLGPSLAPRELEIKTNLPRTRSGKIMRRLLRARELGLPEGDTSSLENDSATDSKGAQ